MTSNQLRLLKQLKKLYESPLTSNRSGVLYNAFSYPTKISPEAVAIFIACHTGVGATILDPFAGSGTTGVAAKLCAMPTQYMIDTAKKMGLKPVWGPRRATLYELSSLGALVSDTMCNPPDPAEFSKTALRIIQEVDNEIGDLYALKDDRGKKGVIRYIIWSEHLRCPNCKHESTFWDIAVKRKPLGIRSEFKCPHCKYQDQILNIPRVLEYSWDSILKKKISTKKRTPVKVYGKTAKRNWSREIQPDEAKRIQEKLENIRLSKTLPFELQWGMLYRNGYHKGITHLHHLYTRRNFHVMASLWEKTHLCSPALKEALRFLILSYNSSHSTIMTRVVIKKNMPDFVLTGAQSGVLYVSNLPVEKNIIDGVKRKISTITRAFELTRNSKSEVVVVNQSSTKLRLPDQSVDYIFTDPPFGDYIPYSEINQVNEAWLGKLTDSRNEVIVNSAQGKGIAEYAKLMVGVFSELNRTLKNDGAMSLVFHTAKAEIWQALMEAYRKSNFQVVSSSILDKIQSSFKQVTSEVKVQGDPLMLLFKIHGNPKATTRDNEKGDHNYLVKKVVATAYSLSSDADEQKPERLFSRYVNLCFATGNPVLLDAGEFYQLAEKQINEFEFA
jgi:DNA modification methylase/transposase-like protein